MSDKILDFLASSFVMLLLAFELGLAVLITLNNVSTLVELIGRV